MNIIKNTINNATNTEEIFIKIKNLFINFDNFQLEKIFYLLISNLINKKISENNFIIIITCIDRQRFKANTFEKINKISTLLKNINLKESGILLKLIYELKTVEDSIIDFVKNIKMSNGTLSKKIIEISMTFVSTPIFLKIMLNVKTYLKSFQKLIMAEQKIFFSENTDRLQKSNYSKECISEYSIVNTSEEIIERLLKLISYFGMQFFIKLDIQIISSVDLQQKSIDDQILYYYTILKKINSYFDKNFKILKLYMDLQEKYEKIMKNIHQKSFQF